MKVKDYPYGKINKRLKEAVKWLNKNKKKLAKMEDHFDYPDYWNMPKTISSKLDSDEVDWLQDQTYDWWNDT